MVLSFIYSSSYIWKKKKKYVKYFLIDRYDPISPSAPMCNINFVNV